MFVGFVHCGYWLVFGVWLRGIAGQKLKRIFGLVGRLIGFDLVAVVRLFSVFDLFSRNCFRQGGIELPYLRRGISNKRDLLQRLLPGLLAVIRCRAERCAGAGTIAVASAVVIVGALRFVGATFAVSVFCSAAGF